MKGPSESSYRLILVRSLNLETSTLSPKLNGQAPGSRLSELGLDFPRELNCVWDIDIADP